MAFVNTMKLVSNCCIDGCLLRQRKSQQALSIDDLFKPFFCCTAGIFEHSFVELEFVCAFFFGHVFDIWCC